MGGALPKPSVAENPRSELNQWRLWAQENPRHNRPFPVSLTDPEMETGEILHRLARWGTDRPNPEGPFEGEAPEDRCGAPSWWMQFG